MKTVTIEARTPGQTRTDSAQQVELQEYVPRCLAPENLPPGAGELLWQEYDRRRGILTVDFPSPKTGNQWQITSRGWVGQLPLAPNLIFDLRPKVPIGNLWRMLEYAFRLQGFVTVEGVTTSDTVAGFFRRLALHLARRVLERGRQGFHRAYLPRRERLPYVRGQLDWRQQRPWLPTVACHYEEHAVDIGDNQILAGTLSRIAQSGLCDEETQKVVRRAYQSLNGRVTPVPVTAEMCVGRTYHRLNQDYQPLHAICRFFLEHSGPDHRLGEHTMMPFLVDMSRLFEQFVAAWLEVHLPAPWRVSAQEKVAVGRHDALRFQVDLVLYDKENRARLVLDTKYKTGRRPDPADVQQITTYARVRGCQEAVLVYPEAAEGALDVNVGDVRLRTVAFALAGDLEANGRSFLQALALT